MDETTNIQRYENTNIDQSITRMFLEASEYASQVKVWITGRGGGACVKEYQWFMEAFNLLFMLSSSKKTSMPINKEIKDSVSKQLDKTDDGSEPRKATMIKLFEEYKEELFRVGILK